MTHNGRKATAQDERATDRHRKSPPCPACHGTRYHAPTCPEATDDTATTIRGRVYA